MNSELPRELERKVRSGDTAAIRRYVTEIRAYQEASNPEVLSMLLEALKHSQDIASRIIIDTLPVVPEIEAALVRMLDTGHNHRDPIDGFIQADVIQKLGKLAMPTALTAACTWTVGALAAGESNRHCVNVGLRSLAHAGDNSSLPIIHDCLNHSDPHIRSTAMYAVGIVQDRTAVPKLIALPTDKSTDPQLPPLLLCNRAAQVLGELGDVQAVEPIAAMIEHGQTGPIPDGAIYALTLLGQPGRDALRAICGRVDADLGEKITFWLS